MKLLFIRHADPDYEKDSLTEKGWREAELLADRISALDVKNFYVSTLGRARDTADVLLKRINRSAQILPWLREFEVYDEELGEERICWDMLPQDWTKIKEHYDKDLWHTASLKKTKAFQEANKVYQEFDKSRKSRLCPRRQYISRGQPQ
jgi:broad specificity phosphatase PhoE